MFKEIGPRSMLSTAVFHLYHIKKMNRSLRTGMSLPFGMESKHSK